MCRVIIYWVVPQSVSHHQECMHFRRFLVEDSYKPSFATVTGRGDNPSYIYIHKVSMILGSHIALTLAPVAL